MKFNILLIFLVFIQGCAGIDTKLIYKERIYKYAYEKNKKEIIEKLGQPSSIEVDGNREILTYKTGKLLWAGVIPYAVIPIPLVLPVGQQKRWYYLENGKVIRVEYNDIVYKGAMCGPFMFLADVDNKRKHVWLTVFCVAGENIMEW